jgi:hypothetical protein
VGAAPAAGSVDLTWNAVPGAAAYGIYRAEGPIGCDLGKTRIGETTATAFSDAGLLDGRTYFYAVMPVGGNPSCLGPMSACASAVPLLPLDPCVPVELQGFWVE